MKNAFKRMVIILSVLAAVTACLSACGKKEHNEEPLKDEGGEVFYSVETQPVDVKKMIPDALALAWSEAEREDDPAYLKKLAEVAEYSIDSISEDGGRFVITATVTCPNLGERLMNISYADLPENKDAGSINAYLCGLIDGLEAEKTTAVAYAEWSGDRLNVSFSDEFVDAMCGKVYSYAKKSVEDYLGARG